MKIETTLYFFRTMAGNNLILKNWLIQENVFKENLILSRKRPTKMSVHDLRVSIKKMKSYLRLKEELTKDEWKESFLKISTVFKSFGRLRDYDMSLTLIRKLERKELLSFISFKEYLSVNRSLTRKWAKQDAFKFNEQEPDVFNQQFDFLPNSKEEVCERIIQLSALKIKKVKNLAKHFQKNAHEIRKQLKDLYYWLKICPKGVAEGFINMRVLDRVLTYLGNWQDHVILKKKIKQYKQDLPKRNEEKAMLKDLEKKLVPTQKEILDRAIKKWGEIRNKKATRPVVISTQE
ncbi:MAG TPA: CHAD domain-containing protein [Chitinophagaceae bacterium]|nr:CHAD domain-containing protein [Chitinophagaceae bacterium]